MSLRVISRVAALICLALMASACAGEATPTSTTNLQPDPSALSPASTAGVDEAPSETTPVEPSQTESTPTSEPPADERPDPDPERPIAPDFSLELADGSIFVLSQETRPVFMVFWAEW